MKEQRSSPYVEKPRTSGKVVENLGYHIGSNDTCLFFVSTSFKATKRKKVFFFP